jgi:hypothetical protein
MQTKTQSTKLLPQLQLQYQARNTAVIPHRRLKSVLSTSVAASSDAGLLSFRTAA